MIAVGINPNFIGENIVLCSTSFAACSIVYLVDLAMVMKRNFTHTTITKTETKYEKKPVEPKNPTL